MLWLRRGLTKSTEPLHYLDGKHQNLCDVCGIEIDSLFLHWIVCAHLCFDRLEKSGIAQEICK